LGGLWHGASWTFLLWGAFHGAGLGLNRIYEGFLNKPENAALKKAGETWLGQALAYVVTMVTVLVGWVLFYAHNLPQALGVLKAMFLPQTASADCMVTHLTIQSTLLPAAALYGAAMLVYWGFKKAPAVPALVQLAPRAVAHSCALLSLFIITIELAPRVASPFIYFQF
ncbi:MAG TPA: hypothetical protein PKC93_14630, partial [Candidatus Obscuribacter sp.]|nr:hypothetical protein [Candidatus Obscuribacter sp.]